MNPLSIDLSAGLLASLCAQTGQPTPERATVRVWSMSGVERVTFPDGLTAIFKYATVPFHREDEALRHARAAGIPVPRVQASDFRDGWLGMLIDDLGKPVRDAGDGDGAAAAVILHASPLDGSLPVLDETNLRALPATALEHLHALRKAARWEDTSDIEDRLDRIGQAAGYRAQGTMLAPYGWVHSEFHPTSVHIGPDGMRLLDFARAFTGPGLLDLASWHGTLDAPDPARLRGLLETYVAGGGHPDALTRRSGLTAEAWALGWHRIWAVEWFMDQAIRWINDAATDPAYMKVVRRHLADAVRLLEI